MTPPRSRTGVLKLAAFALKAAFALNVLLMIFAIAATTAFLLAPEAPNFGGTLRALPREDAVRAGFILMAMVLVVGLFMLVVFAKLLRLVRSAIDGDPFILDNARRLRQVAWLMIGAHVVTAVAVLAMRLPSSGEGFTFGPTSFTAVITILLVFVVAQVFEQGAQLRRDLEGTV